MKSVIVLLLAAIANASGMGPLDHGPGFGDYRSATSGPWHSNSTWEYFNGQAWVPATYWPDSGAAAIAIRSGHTVTITSTLVYDQLVVEVGGQVVVAAGIKHTLADGPGTDLTIDGIWLNQGGTWTVSGGARWLVNDGGIYIHNTSASVSTPLSKAILRSSSTFVYRGGSGLNPSSSFSGRTYGNLHFESSGGTCSVSASGSSPLMIAGNLVIGNGVKWSTGGFSGNITVVGEVAISGEWGGTGSGNQGVHTFGGKFVLQWGGQYTLATAGSSQGAIIFRGDVVCAAPFATPMDRSVVFGGDGVQTIGGPAKITFSNGVTAESPVEIPSGTRVEIASGKDFTASRGMRVSGVIVAAGAGARLVFAGADTLMMQDGEVSISAVFTGGGGAKYLAGNGTWRDITIDPAASVIVTGRHRLLDTGNPLLISGQIEFRSGSTIVFGGGSPQVIAPLTYSNLLIENSSGVSLGGPITVNGLLEVSEGIVRTAAEELFLGPIASLFEADRAGIVGKVSSSQLVKPGVRCSFGNLGLDLVAEEIPPVQMSVARETGSTPSIPLAFPLARTFLLDPLWPLRHSSVCLHYSESELNGLRESRLQVFGSNDGGASWKRIGGRVDTTLNVVTVDGDCSYARLALAEPFPEPTIMSIEPALVEQGKDEVLIVSGSGFMNDSLLVMFGGTGIRVNEFRLEGTSLIMVSVTVDEAATMGTRDITVMTAGGTAFRSSCLNVVRKRNPSPLLSSLAPSSGARLHSQLVTLHGSGFVAGATVASFGSDIDVESTVLDATVMIARLTIPAGASPGEREVSVTNPEPGGGMAVLSGSFTVVNPAPTAIGITPEKVARGSTAELEIKGSDFIPGATSVSLGNGVEVDSMTVLSSLQIRLKVRILMNASLGPQDVVVKNAEPGGGEHVLARGLLVTDKPPSVTAVFPATLVRGASTSVSLIGHGFAPGMMLLSLGDGLVVNSLVVEDSSLISAHISAAVSAEAGPRDLILANLGPLGESCIVKSGFVVENPSPRCSALEPARGVLSEKLVVRFIGWGFFSKETAVDFGEGISVDSIRCDCSGAELKAFVSIGVDAGTGKKSVKVSNKGPGGGAIVLHDAFDVEYPAPVLRSVSPARAYRGQTLEIRLAGEGFLRGSSLVSLLPGIRVDSIAVESPTLLMAKISVLEDAVIGARTIAVANPAPGGGSAKLPHVFNVENGSPVLKEVTPSTLLRGESVELAISGDNFYPGVTTLNIGEDILIDTMWVESRTMIRAMVRPYDGAALIPRNVHVQNPPPGGGRAILNEGLAVINPAPIIAVLTPARGEQGATIRIKLVGGAFIDGGTTLDFGTGVVVEALVVKSSGEIEATIVVDRTADPGPRSVAAINAPPGGGRAELQEGFFIVDRELLSAVDGQGMKPARFKLNDAYPNPFNSSAAIQFEIPERSEVILRVRNLLGHTVDEILSGRRDPGVYRIVWTAWSLPSGVYFVEMTATSVISAWAFRSHKKVVYLK